MDLAAASVGDAPLILNQAFDGAQELSPKGGVSGAGDARVVERLISRANVKAVNGGSLGEMNLVEASASKTGTLSATFRDAQGNEVRLTNLDVEGRLGELGHLSLGMSIRSRHLSLTPARIARDPSRLEVMRAILPLLKRAVDAPSSRSFFSKERYAAKTLVERMERLEREVGAQLSSPLIPPGLDLARLKALRAGGDAFAPWVLFSAPGYRARLTTVKTAEGAASSVFSIHMEVYEENTNRTLAYVRLDPGTSEKDSRVPDAARRLLAGLRTSAARGPETSAVLDDAIWFLERLVAPKASTGRATVSAAALLPLTASGALFALSPLLAGPLIGAAAGLALGWLVWKFKPNKTNKERWYPDQTLFPNSIMGAFWGLVLAPVYQTGSLTMTLATGALMLAAQLWMNLSPIRWRAAPNGDDREAAKARGSVGGSAARFEPSRFIIGAGGGFALAMASPWLAPGLVVTLAALTALMKPVSPGRRWDSSSFSALATGFVVASILSAAVSGLTATSPILIAALVAALLSVKHALGSIYEKLVSTEKRSDGGAAGPRAESGPARDHKATLQARQDGFRKQLGAQALFSSLSQEMITKLIDGGLAEGAVVKDIRLLRSIHAEFQLTTLGFRRDAARVYVLGKGHPFGLGQRVVFGKIGKNGEYSEITLVSFAGAFVQSIVIVAGGKVTSNTVTRLDR